MTHLNAIILPGVWVTCPGLITWLRTLQLEDRLYIYLEYVSGGSIHKLLQEYGAFKEPVVRNYTRQILSGLAYLHNQNTVHRYVFTNPSSEALNFGWLLLLIPVIIV